MLMAVAAGPASGTEVTVLRLHLELLLRQVRTAQQVEVVVVQVHRTVQSGHRAATVETGETDI